MSLEGEQAPDFTLESTAGEPITLSDRLEEGPAVVIVNRGHWCSFCAEQLGTFSEVSYGLWFNDEVDVLSVVVLGAALLRTSVVSRLGAVLLIAAGPSILAAMLFGGAVPPIVGGCSSPARSGQRGSLSATASGL